jgi:8-oxo-dGTP diphosphatase
MKLLFEHWRSYLTELNVAPGFQNVTATALDPFQANLKTGQEEDTSQSAKAVMHRNGKVLLLKNNLGWDLPGGHIKQDENILQGLEREVYEETGLDIIDPVELNYSHGNKRFFAGAFGGGEVMLSDEHSTYGYFDKNQISKLNISEPFMKVISMVLDIPSKNKIMIRIG